MAEDRIDLEDADETVKEVMVILAKEDKDH